MNVALLIVLFFILLLGTVSIGTAMGIVTVFPSLLDEQFTASATYVIRSMISGIDSFPLLAIPMFVLSGVIMAKGGISRKLFDVFTYFLGGRTAGIPCAVVVTCLFYGAISGSAPATVAAVGSMTIPVLVSLGYDKVFSVALVAVSGGLGVIIPPSVPFILYGTSANVSVGNLFAAGILPGILIAVLLMLYAVFYCRRNGEDRETIDAEVKKLHDKGLLQILKESIWALLTPVIILGSIYSGIASPTEAAVIAVYYSLIVSLFIYKTLDIKALPQIFSEAVKTYGSILFVLAAASAFSRVLTLLQVPSLIEGFLSDNFSSKFALLFVINVVLLFVGMVMDTGPAIVILAPILTPIVTGYGVDPVHFGIIMVVNLAIGFVTPPVGINLFVSSSLHNLPMMTIAKKAVPMLVMFFCALILITLVPAISLTLVG